jgi:threonine synthase
MDETGIIHQPADMELMRREIFAVSISDRQTRETIREVYDRYHVMLEPHGAVGWAGLEKYLLATPADDRKEQLFVSLETAHPAKFPEEIRHLLGIDPPLPESLEGLDDKPETITDLATDYQNFKQYLLNSF